MSQRFDVIILLMCLGNQIVHLNKSEVVFMNYISMYVYIDSSRHKEHKINSVGL